MQRGGARTFLQLTSGGANAPLAFVRHDECRHEFARPAPDTNRETAQCSAFIVSAAKVGRSKKIACAEGERISAFVVDRAFHDWNDTPRSANVVPHCQRRAAIAEHEMH